VEHSGLPDTGRVTHFEIDGRLPTDDEKGKLAALAAGAPAVVAGARDAPEEALANLLTALAALGLITDSTTAS